MMMIRGVPNSGFRLIGRIRIVLWTILPNKNMNSVACWAFWCCTCCSDIYHLLMSLANCGRTCMLSIAMTLSSSFVWARAAGTDWVKSAVDVTSCAMHIQYRLTIFIFGLTLFVRIRIHYSDFRPLFGTEVNTKRIFDTSLMMMTHICWLLRCWDSSSWTRWSWSCTVCTASTWSGCRTFSRSLDVKLDTDDRRWSCHQSTGTSVGTTLCVCSLEHCLCVCFLSCKWYSETRAWKIRWLQKQQK